MLNYQRVNFAGKPGIPSETGHLPAARDMPGMSQAYNASVVACNTLGCGAASTISNLQTAAAEEQRG